MSVDLVFQLTHEMRRIAKLDEDHEFLSSWNKWRGKVEKYARVEEKKSGVKKILDNLDVCKTEGLAALYYRIAGFIGEGKIGENDKIWVLTSFNLANWPRGLCKLTIWLALILGFFSNSPN